MSFSKHVWSFSLLFLEILNLFLDNELVAVLLIFLISSNISITCFSLDWYTGIKVSCYLSPWSDTPVTSWKLEPEQGLSSQVSESSGPSCLPLYARGKAGLLGLPNLLWIPEEQGSSNGHSGMSTTTLANRARGLMHLGEWGMQKEIRQML